LASVINLGLSLKSLLDVKGIQCSCNEFGIFDASGVLIF